MRVLLFDLYINGHTRTYLDRLLIRLRDAGHDAVACAPSETLDRLDWRGGSVCAGPAERWRLPAAGAERSRALVAELDLLHDVVGRAGVDKVVLLYADHMLPLLAHDQRPLPPTALVLFRLAGHYAPASLAALPRRGRRQVSELEQALIAWGERADAETYLSLDPYAVAPLAGRCAARGAWLPEPPVPAAPGTNDGDRRGCVLYGLLSPRKGIDRLAAAVEQRAPDGPVVLIGHTGRADHDALVVAESRRMARAGADLRVIVSRPTDAEALAALGAARCAVLPYREHLGMSRVLLEACTTGTPVVVHDFGLLARLVRDNGLGEVVDAEDPLALAAVLRRWTAPPTGEWRATSARCRAFATRATTPLFEDVLLGAATGALTGAA